MQKQTTQRLKQQAELKASGASYDFEPIKKAYQSSAFKRHRRAFLLKEPICVICNHELAKVVDHIIPHKGDLTLFWDVLNWQGLCYHCHNSTKQKEERADPFYQDVLRLLNKQAYKIKQAELLQ